MRHPIMFTDMTHLRKSFVVGAFQIVAWQRTMYIVEVTRNHPDNIPATTI